MISKEDKILIKNLWESKGYGARQLIREFPNKNWKRRSIENLLRKLRETGSLDRRLGSGRPRTSRSSDNVSAVEELVQSQENKPHTHLSTRKIARHLKISQTAVCNIIHDDLSLKCLKRRRAQELTAANRAARLDRSKKLLNRFSASDIDFMWFSDEKIFTVESPRNAQNDRFYVPHSLSKKQVSAKRLLRTRATFCQSIMVSVAISKLGCTELIFVDPGAKINGAYYRDILLMQHMIPGIRRVSGDHFIFQQDSAPAHRARDTIELLRCNTPDFIEPDMWPPNSPDLNPVDYAIWSVIQQRVYETRVHDIDELRQRLLHVWHGLEQSLIDVAVDQWQTRLRACVHANGGHFEHIL